MRLATATDYGTTDGEHVWSNPPQIVTGLWFVVILVVGLCRARVLRQRLSCNGTHWPSAQGQRKQNKKRLHMMYGV